MAHILTAEQLIEERQKAPKKQLPSFGAKDFIVTGSEDEKEKISNILSTTKSLLAGERVEKSNLLSNAEWDKELKLAKVTKKVGKFFETFGHSINGSDYLYPEEALFLLENSNLELFFRGLSVSIQRGYSLLLSADAGCSLNEFRVYSYLSKSGYRVFRHDTTTIAQSREKQMTSSSLERSNISVSVELTASPENSSAEVSKKHAKVLESDNLSRTETTDTPSPENTVVPSRDNAVISQAVSNNEVTEKLDGNKTTIPTVNTETPMSKAESRLKAWVQNTGAGIQNAPFNKVIKKQQRKALLGRIYPLEKQSFYSTDYDLLRSFLPRNRLTKGKSSLKLNALSHDTEFTNITRNFPTFKNGQCTTSMPSEVLLPYSISSKYSSTTMNVETGEITHTLMSNRNSSGASSSHIYSGSLPSETPIDISGPQFTKRVVPAKKNRGGRYFSRPIGDNSRERSVSRKGRRKFGRAMRRVEIRQRQKSNNVMTKVENVVNQIEANSFSFDQFAQQSTNQLPNADMDFKPPLANQFLSGAPNLTNNDIARPNPFEANSVMQAPCNQQIQVKPEFSVSSMNFDQMNQPLINQPFNNEQAPFANPANPLNPAILGQMIASVVSQLLPNQMNQNLPNQSNPNFPNQVTPNFLNQANPNFPNQITPNFPNQANPNFLNQPNPNFPNQSNPNIPNQFNPNFPNQVNQNFQNPMNPNFPNQMNANFSNQGNSGFFNQPTQNFGNQNFGHRYPSQRFQRPYNNYGNNNNNNVSEVTRHARKMHGMAKRMLAVAQAMFKNPEEFTENPENINIYNFSNRFRNPNDQRPWRQNFNDNYRNNYRPRFESNFNNFSSNFGQNSCNSSFGQNFNSNAFNNNNSLNQENHFYPAGDRNNSFRSRIDENNRNRDDSFRSSNNENNSSRDEFFRSRNDENDINSFENSDNAPEPKFNPSATTSNTASRDSNPSPPGERDDLFFVDSVGENPSNLLRKARTIPGGKPTISFADKRPTGSSSSSESSESESDNDDIQVIEPAEKRPEIEMIDVLSSDEDICTSITSKIQRSKQKADTICSKLDKNLKTKHPEVIDIGSSSKKRRLNSDTEVITLDDDVTVIDCEPVQPVARTESDSSSEDSSSEDSSEEDPKDSSQIKLPVAVKEEEDNDIRIKSEHSTSDSTLNVKQESEVSSDSSNQRTNTTTENTAVAITVKRETSEDQREAAGETRNEIDTLNNVRVKSEAEVENLNKSLDSGERSASEADEDTGSDNESDQDPVTKSALENATVNLEQHPKEPSINEEMNETSNSARGEPSVIEKDIQSDKGWAALKAAEKEKLSEVCLDVNKETTEGSTVDKPSAMEVDNTDANKDLEPQKSDAPSSLSEENKSQTLLQPHHCKNLGTVLNALQIFKPAVNEPKNLPPLRVSFDVYQPKKVFGKASRPDPDYRIIVTGYMDPVPSPVQIDEIKNRYSDNIKILFAVVHPSSISFFFIGNVQLPVQIDDLLF